MYSLPDYLVLPQPETKVGFATLCKLMNDLCTKMLWCIKANTDICLMTVVHLFHR